MLIQWSNWLKVRWLLLGQRTIHEMRSVFLFIWQVTYFTHDSKFNQVTVKTANSETKKNALICKIWINKKTWKKSNAKVSSISLSGSWNNAYRLRLIIISFPNNFKYYGIKAPGRRSVKNNSAMLHLERQLNWHHEEKDFQSSDKLFHIFSVNWQSINPKFLSKEAV